jgi:hypothetical protein
LTENEHEDAPATAADITRLRAALESVHASLSEDVINLRAQLRRIEQRLDDLAAGAEDDSGAADVAAPAPTKRAKAARKQAKRAAQATPADPADAG